MTMRIAVLRGGPGDEHEVSLKSGSAVLECLSTNQEVHDIDSVDIFIDRIGEWFIRGVPKNPERTLAGADVVWNALHGMYGEDGGVQRTLDRIGIPHTGSGAYAAALSMNKAATKRVLEKAGVRTPRFVVLGVSPTLPKEIISVFRSFPQPSVVKPVNSGSSVGVSIARSFGEFEKAIANAFHYAPHVLVEEFISGKEATCGVVDGFRGESHYVLPPVEIIPPRASSFFDYDAKYGGGSEERCPGNFSSSETKAIQNAARVAHTTLGLRHYSRSDFIVSPRGGVYFLEVNALPGTTGESLLPKALNAVGVSMNEFIGHIVMLAQKR